MEKLGNIRAAGVIGLLALWCCAYVFGGGLLALGRIAGLIAAAGILAQLMLVSRAAGLDTSFSPARLASAHHSFGLFTASALILPPALIVSHYARSGGVSVQAQFETMLGWEYIPHAVAGAGLASAALVLSLPPARRLLSYETWRFTHMSFYAALALVFAHQVALGGDIGGNSIFVLCWTAAHAFVLAAAAWGRLIRPLGVYALGRFVVEKIVPETTETESIWITGRDMKRVRGEAGQFALLRFWAPGFRLEAHPFSLSQPFDGRALRFTVKKSGDYTAALHNQLRPGTPVLIYGPYGVPAEKNCLGDKALLVAGGIGITPLRALGERLQSLGKHCVLLYANRAQKNIVFRRELAELERGGAFDVHHVLSADPDWHGEKGRIDADMIRRLVPDFSERDVFLCGPPAMMAAVEGALLGLGVPGARIHMGW